jgi:hypothetical protein
MRYQIAPSLVDLRDASRERVMDDDPATYRVMARELDREGKALDPRVYLYVEMQVRNRLGAAGVLVRLKDDPLTRASHLGRADYAIARDGWVRTTVPLPPGTKAERLAEIGFECLVAPDKQSDRLDGECTMEKVSRVFLLDEDYRPGLNLAPAMEPMHIPTGAAVFVPFRSPRQVAW